MAVTSNLFLNHRPHKHTHTHTHRSEVDVNWQLGEYRLPTSLLPPAIVAGRVFRNISSPGRQAVVCLVESLSLYSFTRHDWLRALEPLMLAIWYKSPAWTKGSSAFITEPPTTQLNSYSIVCSVCLIVYWFLAAAIITLLICWKMKIVSETSFSINQCQQYAVHLLLLLLMPMNGNSCLMRHPTWQYRWVPNGESVTKPLFPVLAWQIVGKAHQSHQND